MNSNHFCSKCERFWRIGIFETEKMATEGSLWISRILTFLEFVESRNFLFYGEVLKYNESDICENL